MVSVFTVLFSAAMIRGEALFSIRSTWFVCFPGKTAKDRLTNFKGPGRDGSHVDEFALAERTYGRVPFVAYIKITTGVWFLSTSVVGWFWPALPPALSPALSGHGRASIATSTVSWF